MSDSFWTWFFDPVDRNTRRAINAAASDIANVQGSSNWQFARQIKKLFSLDRAQERELERMRAMVQVLTEQIIELGADRGQVEVRIQAALERLEQDVAPAPQPQSTGGSPYRGALPVAVADEPEPEGTCARCGQTVLLRRTEFTDDGTVCDRCLYAEA